MRLTDFDYELPEELIAQEPLAERDASRLLVIHRSTGHIEHRRFRDLPRYLTEKDCLIFNNSRVIRARLMGKRETGGQIEVLLLRSKGGTDWEVLVKPGRRVLPGTHIVFRNGLSALVLDRTAEGGRVIRFRSDTPLDEAIEATGDVPLPPYIKKSIDDPERYQTVYAEAPGSIAAPTAGLHFTGDMLHGLRSMGVRTEFITLHVGLGTFRPVQADVVEEHRMHEEHYSVSESVVETIKYSKRLGGRVLAVGTTVARTLESSALQGNIEPGSGWTSLFIYPGFRFHVVDALLTNFHLPKSTLLMLVSALAGRDLILKAYREAVEERYRFFSFGDAMLIL